MIVGAYVKRKEMGEWRTIYLAKRKKESENHFMKGVYKIVNAMDYKDGHGAIKPSFTPRARAQIQWHVLR